MNKKILLSLGVMSLGLSATIVSCGTAQDPSPDNNDAEIRSNKIDVIKNNVILDAYTTFTSPAAQQSTLPSKDAIDELNAHTSSVSTVLQSTSTFSMSKNDKSTPGTPETKFINEIKSVMPAMALAQGFKVNDGSEWDIDFYNNASFTFNGSSVNGYYFEIELEGKVEYENIEIETKLEVKLMTAKFDAVSPFIFLETEYSEEREYEGSKALEKMPDEIKNKFSSEADAEFEVELSTINFEAFGKEDAKAIFGNGALIKDKTSDFYSAKITNEEIEGEIEDENDNQIEQETEYQNISITKNGVKTQFEFKETKFNVESDDQDIADLRAYEVTYNGNKYDLVMNKKLKTAKLEITPAAKHVNAEKTITNFSYTKGNDQKIFTVTTSDDPTNNLVVGTTYTVDSEESELIIINLIAQL